MKTQSLNNAKSLPAYFLVITLGCYAVFSFMVLGSIKEFEKTISDQYSTQNIYVDVNVDRDR